MAHYYDPDPNADLKLEKKEVNLLGNIFELYFGGGLFSSSWIDKGTQLLIESALVKESDYVLDMGCGNGVVGISMLKEYGCKVMFSDVNKNAITITRKNLFLNKLDAKIKRSSCYEKIKDKFNVILTNPPQSAGKNVCFEIIEGAHDHLLVGGTLQLVCRHQKGGKHLSQKMEEVFGNVDVLKRKSGYRVYISEKRE